MAFTANALALVCSLSFMSYAMACSCAPSEVGKCSVSDNHAALHVEVIGREDFPCTQFSGGFIAQAKIKQVFKDNTDLKLRADQTVSISSSMFGNLCGYGLSEGTEYIVFAAATGEPIPVVENEEVTPKADEEVTPKVDEDVVDAGEKDKEEEPEVLEVTSTGTTTTETPSSSGEDTASVSVSGTDGGSGTATVTGTGGAVVTATVAVDGDSSTASLVGRKLRWLPRGWTSPFHPKPVPELPQPVPELPQPVPELPQPVPVPEPEAPTCSADGRAPQGVLSTSRCSGNIIIKPGEYTSQKAILELEVGCQRNKLH